MGGIFIQECGGGKEGRQKFDWDRSGSRNITKGKGRGKGKQMVVWIGAEKKRNTSWNAFLSLSYRTYFYTELQKQREYRE